MIYISDIAKSKQINKNYFAIVNGEMILFDKIIKQTDSIEFVFSLPYQNKIADLINQDGFNIVNIDNEHIVCSNINDHNKYQEKLNKYLQEHFIYIYYISSDQNQSIIKFTCWDNKLHYSLFISAYNNLQLLDHRNIGKELDLFHFDNVSQGMVYWHPKGYIIWSSLENMIRKSNNQYNCQEIKTPIIAQKILWEMSGHLEKYSENIMFSNNDNIIRPMNCPMAVIVFNNKNVSYKDLPVRLTEFGMVHRNEPSGSLHGLFRCKSFTQDDGHIFCTNQQINQEVQNILEQSLKVYNKLGFSNKDISVKLSLRPDKKIGDERDWDIAENSLMESLKTLNIEFDILKGEGAFYGPKIELHIKDNMQRSWQCGTIQLDMIMPKRLNAYYTDQDGKLKTPVIIHRAILGSMERMIGILLEQNKGMMPIWISPIQVIILSISHDQYEYAKTVHKSLQDLGIRSSLNIDNVSLNYKIRQAQLQKIPIICVVGKQEQMNNIISVRNKVNIKTIQDLQKYIQNDNAKI